MKTFQWILRVVIHFQDHMKVVNKVYKSDSRTKSSKMQFLTFTVLFSQLLCYSLNPIECILHGDNGVNFSTVETSLIVKKGAYRNVLAENSCYKDNQG